MAGEVDVPADHEVTVYSMAVEPGVHVTPGHVILANLGIAGDDGDRELDQVLALVDEAIARPSDATLVDHAGALAISDLFAPNTPTTVTVRTPVTWVLHDGNVISTMASEYQRSTLITFMHKLARDGIKQAVYFIDPPVDAVAAFAQHMIGLGVVMRQPDDHEGQLAIQIEVKRPDGVVTVLAGTPVPLEGLARTYEPDALVQMAPQVIKMRTEKLQVKDQPIAFRAPKLRQRILDLAGAPVDAALLAEIITRDLPLFLLGTAGSEAPATHAYGDVTAVPAYVDVIGLHWAAADGALEPGTYAPSPADPRPLLKHCLQEKVALAISTFRDRETPVHAIVTPDVIEAALRRA